LKKTWILELAAQRYREFGAKLTHADLRDAGFSLSSKSLDFLMNILPVKVEIQPLQYELIAGLSPVQ
jgi:hypothetical protein